jgi:phosphotransferase system HPr (HPr) family protein
MVRQIVIAHKHGIHVRPSVAIAEIAATFLSAVTLEFAERRADATNVMEILALQVMHGDTVQVTAVGEDDAQALDALQELFERNFGL